MATSPVSIKMAIPICLLFLLVSTVLSLPMAANSTNDPCTTLSGSLCTRYWCHWKGKKGSCTSSRADGSCGCVFSTSIKDTPLRYIFEEANWDLDDI